MMDRFRSRLEFPPFHPNCRKNLSQKNLVFNKCFFSSQSQGQEEDQDWIHLYKKFKLVRVFAFSKAAL